MSDALAALIEQIAAQANGNSVAAHIAASFLMPLARIVEQHAEELRLRANAGGVQHDAIVRQESVIESLLDTRALHERRIAELEFANRRNAEALAAWDPRGNIEQETAERIAAWMEARGTLYRPLAAEIREGRWRRG